MTRNFIYFTTFSKGLIMSPLTITRFGLYGIRFLYCLENDIFERPIIVLRVTRIQDGIPSPVPTDPHHKVPIRVPLLCVSRSAAALSLSLYTAYLFFCAYPTLTSTLHHYHLCLYTAYIPASDGVTEQKITSGKKEKT